MHIIAVGRIKTAYWKDAITHYTSRIKHFCDIRETCVKDGDPTLPRAERMRVEGNAILGAIGPSDVPICLDEKGRCYASHELATFIQHIAENVNQQPCFIIGGAFGLDPSVRKRAKHLVAFGPMTLPHELARVVLYEQLYRAESILHHLPYHHE